MDLYYLASLGVDAIAVHKFLIRLLYTGYRAKSAEAPWVAWLSLYAMLTNCPLEFLLMILMGGE